MANQEEILKVIEERDELRRENERLRKQLDEPESKNVIVNDLVPEDYLPKLWP